MRSATLIRLGWRSGFHLVAALPLALALSGQAVSAAPRVMRGGVDTSAVIEGYLRGRHAIVGEAPIVVRCDKMSGQPAFDRAMLARLVRQGVIARVERRCDVEDPIETSGRKLRRLIVVSVEIDSSSAVVRSSFGTESCTRVDEDAELRGSSRWNVVRMSLKLVTSGHCAVISKPSR